MPDLHLIDWILIPAYALGLWLALAGTLHTIRRIRSGLSLFANRPAGAIFHERWVSGRSSRIPFLLGGRAENCLMVAVTLAELTVRPHFPFVLFNPFGEDLDFSIPRSSIINAARHSKGFFGGGVEIVYQSPTQGRKAVSLYLRNSRDFLRALQL